MALVSGWWVVVDEGGVFIKMLMGLEEIVFVVTVVLCPTPIGSVAKLFIGFTFPDCRSMLWLRFSDPMDREFGNRADWFLLAVVRILFMMPGI